MVLRIISTSRHFCLCSATTSKYWFAACALPVASPAVASNATPASNKAALIFDINLTHFPFGRHGPCPRNVRGLRQPGKCPTKRIADGHSYPTFNVNWYPSTLLRGPSLEVAGNEYTIDCVDPAAAYIVRIQACDKRFLRRSVCTAVANYVLTPAV